MTRKRRPVYIDPAFEYEPQTRYSRRCATCRRLYYVDPTQGLILCPYCNDQTDLFSAMGVDE